MDIEKLENLYNILNRKHKRIIQKVIDADLTRERLYTGINQINTEEDVFDFIAQLNRDVAFMAKRKYDDVCYDLEQEIKKRKIDKEKMLKVECDCEIPLPGCSSI